MCCFKLLSLQCFITAATQNYYYIQCDENSPVHSLPGHPDKVSASNSAMGGVTGPGSVTPHCWQPPRGLLRALPSDTASVGRGWASLFKIRTPVPPAESSMCPGARGQGRSVTPRLTCVAWQGVESRMMAFPWQRHNLATGERRVKQVGPAWGQDALAYETWQHSQGAFSPTCPGTPFDSIVTPAQPALMLQNIMSHPQI